MPYAWVEPPLLARGITGCWNIYYAYKDNNADGNVLQFWYGVEEDGETLYFDVRDLPKAKHGVVSLGDVMGQGIPPERKSHVLRIFSAMLHPEFDFMAWLEEHGCSEGEL